MNKNKCIIKIKRKEISMKNFVKFVLGLMVCLLVGCGTDPMEPMKNVPTGSKLVKEIVDFGNGVYYFPYIRAEYGRTLSHFIATHPELRYVDAAPDGTGDAGGTYDSALSYEYGRTVGYFVVFEKRE